MGQALIWILALVAFGTAGISGDPTAVGERAGEGECSTRAGSATLLVGDSHTAFSGCGLPGWDVDAEPGRTSIQAVEVVDRAIAARHRRLIFDIGTNDTDRPDRFRENLSRMLGETPGVRVFLVTTYVRLPDERGNVGRGVNAAIRDAAQRHPRRVEVIDWAGLAQRRGFEPTDCCHFTPEAYARRAKLIAAEAGPGAGSPDP